MEKPKAERLTLPDAGELQQMLRLANDLHGRRPGERLEAALRGIAELAAADAVAAWSGPAERLTEVGVFAIPPNGVPQASLLPKGVGLLIGRRPTLSPVVRLHTNPISRQHEIRSVCGGPDGPSLLVLRRYGHPFDQRQRSIVHLLHPQLEWALRPFVSENGDGQSRNNRSIDWRPGPLSPKHKPVLKLLLAGHTEKQMADELAINPHTVHSRVKQIYRHFNVGSRAQLLAKFVVTERREI